MAFPFSAKDHAQPFASPLRPEDPSDFELEDLLPYGGLMMDDWLIGIQDAPPVDGSIWQSVPLSNDGAPSGCVPSLDNCGDNVNVENAGTGQSTNGSDGTRSSNALNVQDVDSFDSQVPSALLPSKPSKPSSTKKRKVRPKDKLNSLQKQLDDIMAQVQQLTLVNEQLHCKNDVLTSLLESSDVVEIMSATASRQMEACIKDPSGPHPPVIRTMHSLTPQSWLAFYNDMLAKISHCVIHCGDSDQAASDEATRKLAAVWKEELCVHIQYAITLRRDIFFQVQGLTYQQFAGQHREDDFWGDVVRSLQLTPTQEQRIVQACDIYERCRGRLTQQLRGLGDALVCRAEACSISSGVRDESLLEQVTSNMMQCKHLIKGLGNWLYGSTLTPLQGAQCFLQLHPLLPNPILMLTAVAQEVRSRQPPAHAAALQPFALHGKGADWAAVHDRPGLAAQVR